MNNHRTAGEVEENEHTNHKPPDSSLLSAWQSRMEVPHPTSGDCNNPRTETEEDPQQKGHRVFICEVRCDFDFEGVVRVVCYHEGSSRVAHAGAQVLGC